MALYYNGEKISCSLVIDGNVEPKTISLANYCRIGVTATDKAQSPVDANNYIDVSGNVVTLKRNNTNYHLWIYTPILLQAGKTYTITFDSISGSDGNFYMEKTSDISVNPIYATRYDTVNHSSSVINGIVIKPDTDAYYGIAIWSQSTADIVITNPKLIVDYIPIGDGNNKTYPVNSPSQYNYLYKEDDINNIAIALDKNVKVSEMASAITQIMENTGLHATNYPVYSDTYTEAT